MDYQSPIKTTGTEYKSVVYFVNWVRTVLYITIDFCGGLTPYYHYTSTSIEYSQTNLFFARLYTPGTTIPKICQSRD